MMCDGANNMNASSDTDNKAMPTDTSTTTSSSRNSRIWPEESMIQQEPQQRYSHHVLSNLYARLTYSYMDRILRKGAAQHRRARRRTPTTAGTSSSSSSSTGSARLEPDDLFLVPKSMESKYLSHKFHQFYNIQNSRPPPLEDPHRNHTHWRHHSHHPLLTTLWKLAVPTFVPAGVWQLVAVLCQVGMPLIVRELLRILEDNPQQNVVKLGIGYAIGLFLILALNGLSNHRHRHLALQSGIVLRATMITVIYEHVLHFTPKGRAGLTSGQVTNLVAVDTQKLFEVTQEAHLVWSLPLAIVVVTLCLVFIQGPTTLVGVAVLMAFVPIVERVTSKMLQIRQQRAAMTDQRIEIVSTMLQGIKVTKLNNYEDNYQKRIMAARDTELVLLGHELAVWGLTLVLTVISPILASAATFITYVLIDENNVLTASDTFSVLLLFSALRFPINYSGRLIGKAAQAFSALKRIAAFLQRECRRTESSGQDKSGPEDDNTLLRIRNGTFGVGAKTLNGDLTKPDTEKPTYSFLASGFNFTVKRGETLGVVGPVASGKSTLINGIIGEAARLGGTELTTKGKVVFVPQTPFILNATLRENIVFGLPFDHKFYCEVIEACALSQDIEQLGEHGDLTEIGERGVTLSGGQKQRVSLARAAYSRADLLLLDDPLSALDAGTAKTVFENVVSSPNALFKEKAVILVTHAAHLLSHLDNILLVVDGKSAFHGNWKSLLQFESNDVAIANAIAHITSSIQETMSDDNGAENNDDEKKEAREGRKHKLMAVEEREHGLSDFRTWLLWFHHAGGAYFICLQAVFMTLDRVAYVGVEYWLSRWSDSVSTGFSMLGIEFEAQNEGRSAQKKFILVYTLIISVSIFATLLRSEWVVTGGKRAASGVFRKMLSSVLKAPMVYFETTPMGRILNRFTFDMEVIDVRLTENMSILLVSCGWFITGIVVMCTILPYIAFAIFPVTFIYWMLLLHYRKSGPDLQRLDALSRSPIQAKVSEGLEGSSTIRVFSREQDFLRTYHGNVDQNSSALLNFITAQRWLGFRIEILGSVVVLTSSLLVVCLNETLNLDTGIVALLILWSSNFTITLGFFMDAFSEAEAAITAIERVDAMTQLPSEPSMDTPSELEPDASWPSHGILEFRNVCMRYREELPLVLNNLSFRIPGGARVGVVGRTGAGKSSLAVALFRLTEIESGEILLDGRSLSDLGLKDVRGRPNGMAVIPQDPFLAGTTLRECLDPFSLCDDKHILDALRSVRLAKEEDGVSKLDLNVEEGGSNFSVGERQLLNLARALLTQPRVLVLDEATASVDGETDALIQQMLRQKFRESTVISIAHRLNTIMDYDYVLVMSEGRAVEFGSPAELLQNERGTFSELVNSTGSHGAAALRSMTTSQAP